MKKEEYIKLIDEKEEELLKLKMEFTNSYLDDFDVWSKYSVTKTEFPYLLNEKNEVMKLFREFIPEIFYTRYSKIELEDVLMVTSQLLFEGKIDEERVSKIKKHLSLTNFGSMIINW